MSTRQIAGIRVILAAVITTTCAPFTTSEAAAATGDPGLVAAGSNVRYGPGTGWQVNPLHRMDSAPLLDGHPEPRRQLDAMVRHRRRNIVVMDMVRQRVVATVIAPLLVTNAKVV